MLENRDYIGYIFQSMCLSTFCFLHHIACITGKMNQPIQIERLKLIYNF